MPKVFFAQLECPSLVHFPETETVHQPSDYGKFTDNSIPTDARTDVVDLLHFLNVIGDLATEEGLVTVEDPSASDKKDMGARIMVPGFVIPGRKLILVN